MMYVSLEISNSNIKILSLKGRQVIKWGSAALKGGLVRDGLIMEPQSVAEAVNELFKATGIRKENVAVSLAGLSFTYRFLNLPRMKQALLEEAVMRAARKEMSLPPEELYLSWRSIPGKAEEQSFFVLGVPRNPVDAAVKALNIAGIEPYAMELQPLALARAANRRDAIAVSIDSECFNIVFIADGIPRVIHTLSPRGEGATLEDNIRRLADELSKTAAFYQSSHPETRFTAETPLLLAGDMAAEAPAAALLQAETEYPVEPLAPPVEFPPGIPSATYASTSGLALNYLSRKSAGRTKEGFYDININILSGKYRKSRAKTVSAFQVWLGIFLAAAVVLLFPLHIEISKFKNETIRLENELRQVNLSLNMANLIAAENAVAEADIQTTVNATLNLRAANQAITGSRGSYTGGLKAVTDILPEKLLLTSIEIDADRITLSGEAENVFTVIDYALALEAEPFREVRISRLDEAVLKAGGGNETESSSNTTSNIIFEIVINK
jgi:Tfp pilus assembly PilM family ATPase/Tfp pilus assembly protein PilN